MTNRKRYSSKLRQESVHGEALERGSNANDANQAARRGSNKEPWADGFLASNGAQIPLFVRQAQRLK